MSGGLISFADHISRKMTTIQWPVVHSLDLLQYHAYVPQSMYQHGTAGSPARFDRFHEAVVRYRDTDMCPSPGFCGKFCGPEDAAPGCRWIERKAPNLKALHLSYVLIVVGGA